MTNLISFKDTQDTEFKNYLFLKLKEYQEDLQIDDVVIIS
jgi:hypothetical protein